MKRALAAGKSKPTREVTVCSCAAGVHRQRAIVMGLPGGTTIVSFPAARHAPAGGCTPTRATSSTRENS